MDARFQGNDFLVLFFITTYQGYVMPFLIELNNLIASYAKNESHKEQLACTAGPHRKANHAAVGGVARPCRGSVITGARSLRHPSDRPESLCTCSGGRRKVTHSAAK